MNGKQKKFDSFSNKLRHWQASFKDVFAWSNKSQMQNQYLMYSVVIKTFLGRPALDIPKMTPTMSVQWKIMSGRDLKQVNCKCTVKCKRIQCLRHIQVLAWLSIHKRTLHYDKLQEEELSCIQRCRWKFSFSTLRLEGK